MGNTSQGTNLNYTELLRRSDDSCVQPKGLRKIGVFCPADEETEENASRAYQISHTVVLFKYMLFSL
jgi:hypothetical protein